VYYRLTTRGIGNKCSLDVVRKGHKMTVALAVRAPPKASRDDVRNLSGTHPFDGARVANILPGTAAELGLEEEDGVVILSVQPASRSARLGFRTGDIIVQVGREKIDSIGELEAQLKERPRVWQVVVKRGNQLLQLQLSG
jgi:predicted metalloprotease with PDZ domain